MEQPEQPGTSDELLVAPLQTRNLGLRHMEMQKPTVPGERQGPIHTAIVNELIALTPEWWNAATLIVGVSTQEGIQAMPHEIRSPEGHREPITPSDQLFDLTHQLFRLFQEYGQPWKQAVYEVSLDPEGAWKWKCGFTYQ